MSALQLLPVHRVHLFRHRHRLPHQNSWQVMLGAKSTRYNNIELLLAKPAYQSRNSKFIVQMPGGRKEVLREEAENSQQAADSQGGSLFD